MEQNDIQSQHISGQRWLIRKLIQNQQTKQLKACSAQLIEHPAAGFTSYLMGGMIVLALTMSFALASARNNIQAIEPEPQITYDVQPIQMDDVDYEKELDFTGLNQNLDYFLFVHLVTDNKDVHVIVDTIDYSTLNETVVELHIADDTLVTRELESKINHEITEYFDDKRHDWLKEEARIMEEIYAEDRYHDLVYWANR